MPGACWAGGAGVGIGGLRRAYGGAALLRRVLEAATGGSPGVVVVRGEAGIGKTRLVTGACRSATGMQVLWGRCLQLDTFTLPYLPFVSALAGWRADDASLDVPAYVVAGLRSQRLAVLLTVRSGQLAEGDRPHGWLADIRRLPCVAELELPRMDAEETGDQLRVRPTRGPGSCLRSCRGALRSALLASWHRLPQPAREVTPLLAGTGGARPSRRRPHLRRDRRFAVHALDSPRRLAAFHRRVGGQMSWSIRKGRRPVAAAPSRVGSSFRQDVGQSSLAVQTT